MYKEPEGFSRELHRKMAEQGWTGLLVPEAQGGLGLTMLDMAVRSRGLGRLPCCVPNQSPNAIARTATAPRPIHITRRRGAGVVSFVSVLCMASPFMAG